MSQSIAELIASLPEEERIILSLHYLAGKSVGEIAALLSVPDKSVAVVIDSGKKRLSEGLGL
jgi:DNA-directed RNA polymerase specialized sigma24 family protein